MIRKLAGMLGLWCVVASAHAGPVEDKLMACMRGNIPPTLRIQEFQLTSVDRKGEKRLMQGKLFAKRENELLRAMLKLTSPADVNGAAYLIREGVGSDEMYVFLPALNRTRRIKGGAGDGPLFGTDLSYADIKQVQNAFTGSTPKIEAREKIDNRPVTVLGVVPAPAADSHYSRIKAWIDDESCVALKVEFLEGATTRKRLQAATGAITKAGNYWYVNDSTMTDLKLGTKTQLKITGVKSGEDIANRYFDSRNFFLGN
ncbi:MAG: outer membrane lipoprotein-sorting protein [Stagnimonas sp.]|nr:outer membrane lipoprotein-sorting protein [Stagnimonas sp.]